MMDQATTVPDQAELDDFLGATPPSRRSRYIRWALILIGLIAILWISSRFFGGGQTAAYATRPVERGALTVTVSATGNLQPTNQVEVGSELSGLIAEVLVDNNDRVMKGQVLARLDTSRLQDAINQSLASLQVAQASVGTAEATVDETRATLNRLQQVYRLSGGKVPSATELDTARAAYQRAVAGVRSAEASVAQARAQLSSDQTQFSKASIRSPVNGVVLSRRVEPGQTVAASLNAPVLFLIAEDLSRMKLEAKVDEADVGQVRAGQRAAFTVDAFPGRDFPARIERVDVGANATGSTTSSTSSAAANTVVAYTAVLSLSNPDLMLRPGMTATADIVTMEKQNVMLVPNAALRFSPERAARQGGGGGVTSVLIPRRPGRRGGSAAREVTIGRGSRQSVYVVGADGDPQPIRVTVGDSDGSQTEVTSEELKPGMEVITGQFAGGAGGGGQRQGGGQRGGQRGANG
ncbi:efflux transporter periplasmic adaptor subunit [Sphingomonas oleivorans]|uniref:Efflux transporter periplasmic adaptor subunit n=1 Tax=Sphingomonas oleivorans TaxID=1735121 RepID=A0A2T5FV00_9SPHN|nr:efflux RND transporter periplasmic adaptor subunit [Sphingomonas oleivorans]PTQ08553.1 efflux transporter periplasmic adaptor subunit [Sphingomonas oleivorans]